MASKITLNTAQPLAPPTATWVEWRELNMDLAEKVIESVLVWHNATSAIPVNGQIEQHKRISNIPDDPDTPEDEKDNRFNKCWKYDITEGDVGKPIGKVLLGLVWNQIKGDLVDAGNDGAIDDV